MSDEELAKSIEKHWPSKKSNKWFYWLIGGIFGFFFGIKKAVDEHKF